MTNTADVSGFAIRAVETREEEEVLSRHFGTLSPLIECAVQLKASMLCRRLRVGRWRWNYYEFSGDGLYMAPEVDEIPVENKEIGFQGTLSKHAFGIAASLLAYAGFAGVGEGSIEQHASLLCVLAAKHSESDLIRQTIAGHIH